MKFFFVVVARVVYNTQKFITRQKKLFQQFFAIKDKYISQNIFWWFDKCKTMRKLTIYFEFGFLGIYLSCISKALCRNSCCLFKISCWLFHNSFITIVFWAIISNVLVWAFVEVIFVELIFGEVVFEFGRSQSLISLIKVLYSFSFSGTVVSFIKSFFEDLQFRNSWSKLAYSFSLSGIGNSFTLSEKMPKIFLKICYV